MLMTCSITGGVLAAFGIFYVYDGTYIYVFDKFMQLRANSTYVCACILHPRSKPSFEKVNRSEMCVCGRFRGSYFF